MQENGRQQYTAVRNSSKSDGHGDTLFSFHVPAALAATPQDSIDGACPDNVPCYQLNNDFDIVLDCSERNASDEQHEKGSSPLRGTAKRTSQLFGPGAKDDDGDGDGQVHTCPGATGATARLLAYARPVSGHDH